MAASSIHKLFSLIVLLSLVMQPLTVLGKQVDEETKRQGVAAPPPSGLYRTTVTVDSPARRARLDALGVVVLADEGRRTNDESLSSSVVGPSSVLVLADADQLETLARLRFAPRATDDADALIAHHAASQPALAAAWGEMAQRIQTDKRITTAAASLSAYSLASVAALSSIDDDGDGLTNTEEAWWCTDPLNPNSDGDAQGYTDGQEVAALLDFTLSRTVRWGYGPPFGPPAAWPNFNNRDGNGIRVCNDGDKDTIPDFAEVFMVGTRVPEESTDHDKFDDGQELFGTTFCPGDAPNPCWGTLPAGEYWNFIQVSMPNWVLPPGDSPLVAAFPVPEVYVTPGSWHVERVTTITTSEGQMAQTSNTYETSAMRGHGTSIADTVTWNNWEAVSQAIDRPLGSAAAANASPQNPGNWLKFFQTAIKAGAPVVKQTARQGWTLVKQHGPTVVKWVASNLAWDAISQKIGLDHLFGPEQAQEQRPPNNYPPPGDQPYCSQPPQSLNLRKYSSSSDECLSSSPEVNASVVMNEDFNFQSVGGSTDGVAYAIDQNGNLLARALYDISYAISQPRFTETRTNGHSWGGAQTTTHEIYEEHTQTEGVGFTTGQNWSTAWAVDSSHAADLTFEFSVKNTGTEYARELSGIVVNVYIGDDTRPAISYPAWQKFPNGKLENLFPVGPNTPPGQFTTRTFTTDRIPLSLEQMKRIDLGERLTVKVESYSYGADELFYANAVTGGVTVYVEDGVEDGDETVDSYVIPTWGVESVQDVLTRYFRCPPGQTCTDAEGNLNALWTPEYDGINPPAWNEHYLSDIASWNVYLTQADAGETSLQDLPAQAGSGILFRFNRDSDRDGYNDRAEFRYYCSLPASDPDHARCADAHLRPEIHPQPEVSAGYVAERSGNVVMVKLAVANSGMFDAYSIDAVMYSPDGTTTIGNNTVGGNGRVRPGNHVAVGSLIKAPDLANWGASTAKPYAGGQFSGAADRTFTFTAATPGVVGQGATALTWIDGQGITGTLSLGSSYHAPLPMDVGQGVQVGLNTGTITAGARFTVQALTPRDTFTYTVVSEPFTPPVIVVSYSDPQGSHRFVTSVELPRLDAGIAAGQMLEGLKLDIVTPAALDASGANTTHLVVNSPHSATIQGGHLYLNFISDGKLVLEKSYTLNISAGPTVFPADWSVTEFSADYHPAGDNLLIAFWTDSEGNIIDSAARPLNSFAEDPKPAFAMAAADATWDFGTAQQGTLLQRTFTLGSVGYMDLLTHLGAITGATVSGPTSRSLPPGDTATYTVMLNTQTLPVGPFLREIEVRTSDPHNPRKTITIRGNIRFCENCGTWQPVSADGAPSGRHEHTAVWTGTEMIVWGGRCHACPAVFGDGGAYNPVIDTWRPLPTDGAPFARHWHTAVWTGSEMIIWGGINSTVRNDGAAYNPTTNTWRPLSTLGVPSARHGHSAVWTGTEMIVWGGHSDTAALSDSGAYNPATNTWRALPTPSDVSMRWGHTAVWTGKEVLVWGGTSTPRWLGDPAVFPSVGGAYNPTTNTWRQIASPGSALGRVSHAAVWTGDEMLVWGGINTATQEDGYGYDPLTNAWRQLASMNAVEEASRYAHTAVWTGRQMVVWGGLGVKGAFYGDGGLFLPSIDGWDPVSLEDAPEGREQHSAVWTGTEMIIWGGQGAHIWGNGARYTPQPGALAAAAVEMGADRPLDVPVVITGTHNQGEAYDFTHTLGPNVESLQPCKVYDQGGTIMKGVGKYCSDFGPGTASHDIFGDGRDGVMPSSGNLDNNNGVGAAIVNSGSAGAYSVNVTDVYNGGRINLGDAVLIHQTQGTGAGCWELNKAASDYTGGMAAIQLTKPLQCNYASGGNNHAQLQRVPQYTDCPISGAIAPLSSWNGVWGGIFAVMCNGATQVLGAIDVAARGYRGGSGGLAADCSNGNGYQGENQSGIQSRIMDGNGVGGGGGQQDKQPCGRPYTYSPAGGGGGGNRTSGTSGQNGHGDPDRDTTAGVGGGIYGGSTQLTFGGGGGGGGGGDDGGEHGSSGGSGGGIAVVYGQHIRIDGSLVANGSNGGGNSQNDRGGGGGGAGGSILIVGGTVDIGEVKTTARGGSGGSAVSGAGSGGSAGQGQVVIQYCESVSGSTDPAASTQKLNCYIVDQAADPTHGLLNLPESGAHTYLVQYGRRYTFAAAGQATSYLRVKRQVYSPASLDALVSNTGVASGNLDLCLDIGADGSCDYHFAGSQTFPTTLSATGLANAFNTYLLAQTGIAWGAPVDVPVRVQVDRQTDVMLTNLALTLVGAKTRFLRLPARAYDSVSLGIQFGAAGTPAGPLAFTVDVGADGTVDHSFSGTPASYPAVIAVGNAAVTSAFNTYLAGRTGEVDVPIRIVPSPSLDTSLASFSATPSARPDLQPANLQPGTGGPTEGDTIIITATIRNAGSLATGLLTAAFYATPAGGTPWYIGSAFVPSVAASSQLPASIPWNTLGFTGPVTITATADPYNRVAESNETNNTAAAALTIRTRPDLSIPAIALSDPAPVAGKPVTVTATLRNGGQTAAAGQTTTLYNGSPDAGGAAIGNRSVASIAGGESRAAVFTWTPARPGPYRLFARTDRTGVVGESDEGNNDAWLDVYVGFGSPIALDSGSTTADPAYTAGLGYGVVDTGQPDVRVTCAGQPDPTLRRDPSNRAGYRFDHLQPGRFYHLDVILYECDNLSRIQRVLVDDMLVGGPVSLGDQAEHRLSIRLDPAFYRDHAINVAVIGEEGSQRGAVVASVALREIDYRYADSGAANDPVYTAARGWGYLTEDSSVAIPGTLPQRSARVNQGGPELRYRFDRLDPAKRYQVALTFWQATGNPLLQRVRVDGLDTPATVNLVAGTVTTATVRLSPAAYTTDGSVVVSVVVLNAGAGATVNEISLEEETLLTESPCRVRPSASLSLALGGVTVNGLAAPPGTVATAENPRGDIVGCYVVGTDGSPAGQYGFMAIYGEDASASPPIPGMRAGELVTFRVDGALAQATPFFYWHNDTTEHWTDLVAVPLSGQSILLPQTWSFLSFRVAPPVPLLEAVLGSIAGKYDRVLGEEGFWSADIPPQFRTLTELRAGRSYYLRLTVPSANLLIEGSSLAVTTPLPLHPQWNWVGYLPQTAMPVTVALGSIAGSYQRVLGTAGQFYDVRYPTFSTLKQMAPGQGYRIYATQAATLTYPTTTAAAAPVLTPKTPGDQAGACRVTPTPNLTLLFGALTVNDRPAAVGALVEALTPRGEVAGCFVVETPGQYGFMAVFGEDPTARPPIPGFRADEPVRLRVNGLAVAAAEAIRWQDDLTPHQADLAATPYRHWLPLIAK